MRAEDIIRALALIESAALVGIACRKIEVLCLGTLARCGFRYNAYGISQRYRCNECLRKFSVKHIDRQNAKKTPSETIWLLAEIGMVLTKIENLIEKASSNLVGNPDGLES